MTWLFGGQRSVTLGCAANLALDLRAAGIDESADALADGTASGYARARYRRPMTATAKGVTDQLGLRPAPDLTAALGHAGTRPHDPIPSGQDDAVIHGARTCAPRPRQVRSARRRLSPTCAERNQGRPPSAVCWTAGYR